MLTEYISRMMRKALYKLLADGTYFGEIPGISGVWASAKSLEECRAELQSVLENWLVLKVQAGDKVTGLAIPTEKQKIREYA